MKRRGWRFLFSAVFSSALAAIFALCPFAGFAMTSGEQLYQYGLIKGTSAEKAVLNEELPFTREQLAKIICEVMGKTAEAAECQKTPPFSDVRRISDWAKPYVAYVAENGWMKGVGDRLFDPKGDVSEQQLGAVFLRAMGYDYPWEKTYVALSMKGIAPSRKTLTRGQAFDYMLRALTVPIDEESGLTLLEKLGVSSR